MRSTQKHQTVGADNALTDLVDALKDFDDYLSISSVTMLQENNQTPLGLCVSGRHPLGLVVGSNLPNADLE